jgi:sarcosine oxidase subunit gamma
MADAQAATLLRRAEPEALEVTRPELSVQVERDLGIAKLRVHGAGADTRFAMIVGTAPPAPCEQISAADLTLAWLAPGEWMATGPEPRIAEWVSRIANAGDEDALAVDITHARTAFVVAGTQARSAISAHCPLDLWPEVFGVHSVGRSLLGETGTFIARLTDGEDGARFRIVVDQTMAAYAARMLAGV